MPNDDPTVPNNDRPGTPIEWWTFLRRNGLRATLRILTVGQIYTIASTVVAIPAAVIAVFPNIVPRPYDLLHCSAVNGYPLGKWIESGKTTVYDKESFPSDATPGLAEFIWFDTPTSGYSQTDEPNSAGATFTLAKDGSGNYEQLAPNQPVTMISTDRSSNDPVPYVSVSHLTVSADGCYMTGSWFDNEDEAHKGRVKQRGTVTFFWFAPTSFWIRRDLNRQDTIDRPVAK
jgi:hypothetical protein